MGTIFNAGGYMKKINWKKVKSFLIKAKKSAAVLIPVIKGVIKLWKK